MHLWVWPDSSFSAQGQTYDGGVYSLSSSNLSPPSQHSKIITAQNTLHFSTYHPTATVFIVQIALENSISSVVDSATSKPLQQLQRWTNIVVVNPIPTSSGWFYDSQQRVLWMVLVRPNYKVDITFQ